MPVNNNPKPVVPGREIHRDNFAEVLSDAAHDAKVTKAEAEVILHAVEENTDSFESSQVDDAKALFQLATEANPEMAALAVNSGNIQSFQSALRMHIHTLTEPQIETTDVHSTEAVRKGIPLGTDEPLKAEGPHGTAYLVGAGRKIDNMEVNLRPIKHSVHGEGVEARFKVARGTGNEIEEILAKHPDSRIVEKKVRNHGVNEDGTINVHEGDDPNSPEDVTANKLLELNQKLGEMNNRLGELEKEIENASGADLEKLQKEQTELKTEVKTAETEMNKLSGVNSYSSYSYGSSNDGMSLGHCVRVEEAGKFRIDYFPEEVAKQALRGAVHIEAFGANEEEKKANLEEAMKLIALDDEVKEQPTDESLETLKLMRILWQAAPKLAGELAKNPDLNIEMIEDALEEAKVPDDFIDEARFGEVAPGRVSVIVPGQAEAYYKAGVRALIHTIQNPDKIVDIIADGALSCTQERLASRNVIKGMSSEADLKSGGADYVFTRIVTEKLTNPSMSSRAVISFNLDLLDRADWFAYPSDKYGSTYMDAEAGDSEISEALKTITSRTHPNTDAFLDKMRDAQDSGNGANSFWERPTGRKLVKEIDEKTTGNGISSLRNEAMFQGHIPVSMMNFIVVNSESQRESILTKLEERGVTEINGAPAADFVKMQDTLYPKDENNEDVYPTYI
ncbi:MAG: hypothetical protein EP343_22835 [Deltaproteobacteria bacterium]|nr:MAG: hypothetical protein EP343_22835 [Deltaproteobacteria bacterium]